MSGPLRSAELSVDPRSVAASGLAEGDDPSGSVAVERDLKGRVAEEELRRTRREKLVFRPVPALVEEAAAFPEDLHGMGVGVHHSLMLPRLQHIPARIL